MEIQQGKIICRGFIKKAYTEGTYSDSPKNRALGIVGLSYKKESSATATKSESSVTKSTRVVEKLKFFEDKIVRESGNKFEIAYVCSPEGNDILYKEGNKDSIAFDPEEINILKESKAIFTHNHPNSRCFSLQDLILSIHLKMQEIRAVAVESIKGNGTWVFEVGSLKEYSEFKQEYTRINNSIHDEIFEKMREAKEISDEEEDKVITYGNLAHHYLVLDRLMNNTYYGKKIQKENNVKFYFEPKNI